MKQATDLTDFARPVLVLLDAMDSDRAFDDAKVLEVYAKQGDVRGVLQALAWSGQDFPENERLAGAIEATTVILLAVA